MRRVVGVSIACVFLVLGACGGGGSDNKTLDASFSRFNGSKASIRDYRGKPVVVNFFSSTCVPCQTEMPALEQVHRKAGAKVAFLGLDVQDTVPSGQAFVESVGVTWDMGLDPDASILQSLGGTALPTTVLLDANGKIVYQHLGALDVDDLDQQLRQHGFIT
ncbi:MAG TPA: TlpA disulfide reductase family protein [Acidimicrobiales bacterium]|jgi:thiol-disulfide isomerase/thioredoxin|nr:TlpA disulfide reductase family protein [Acidimicrobiales bacterium]